MRTVTDRVRDTEPRFRTAVRRLPDGRCTCAEAQCVRLTYADAGASNDNTNDFRATSDHWIYNLDTTGLGLVTNKCYRLDVSLDGIRISTQQFAVFKPTK